MTDPISTDDEQFFSVKHAINLNVIPCSAESVPQTEAQLIDEIPTPFRISVENASAEAASLRSLRSLGEHYQELITYLQLQSKKIDTLTGYLLALQDDPQYRFTTVAFGAGGISYRSSLPLAIGQMVQLKLFLSEEAAAVYCYGKVTNAEVQDAEKSQYLIEVAFYMITEQDRELLIRASLHIQSKQLKARSEALLAQRKERGE